ncbi:hypothetical protein EW146_g657 [Bondarzewia mesenterica]|uniref:Uncharacterized protein n=1 Tax=Bondarzewia mesenterica TaxID=1095465 RepID=A0A4S4MCH6_9AGAM|nr:hypothetical protein EW146_g657 [Bondarzewia mesenterica]
MQERSHHYKTRGTTDSDPQPIATLGPQGHAIQPYTLGAGASHGERTSARLVPVTGLLTVVNLHTKWFVHRGRSRRTSYTYDMRICVHLRIYSSVSS